MEDKSRFDDVHGDEDLDHVPIDYDYYEEA